MIRFTAGFILLVCNHYVSLVFTFCEQQWDEGWWSGKICHYCSGLYNLRERLFQNKKKVFSHLHAEYFIISYNCVKLQVTLSRQADQGPVSWKARKLFSPRGKFWSQNLLNIVAQFLVQKPVNFALLTDIFII